MSADREASLRSRGYISMDCRGSLHRAATCRQSRKGEEVAQKKPRDSGENRKESRNREIIRIGEEGAWT